MQKRIKSLTFFFLLIFFGSCDNYSDTKIFFSSDKEEYKIGNDLVLTLNMIPVNEKKRVKLYSDLSNIDINGIFKFKRNPGESMEYRYEKVKKTITTEEYPRIISYYISPKDPLKFDLKGKITENDTSYIIHFASIKTKYFINKKKYSDAETFGFEGFCEPVNSPIGYSYEDFITFLPIIIKEDED